MEKEVEKEAVLEDMIMVAQPVMVVVGKEEEKAVEEDSLEE